MLVIWLIKTGGWAIVETLFKIIGGLTLTSGSLYLALVLAYAKSEKAVFRQFPLFSMRQFPILSHANSAEILTAQKKCAVLKNWILLQAKTDTALPDWFLKEIQALENLLHEQNPDLLLGKKKEIYRALLAKKCGAKAAQFFQKFLSAPTI